MDGKPFWNLMDRALPVEIAETEVEFINQSYFRAADVIGDVEYRYILEKFNEKIANVNLSKHGWVTEMANAYSHLFAAAREHNEGRNKLTDEAYKLICAAVFYFVNPFDVIPDHIPDVGYADDFLVLQTCLKTLKGGDAEIIATLMGNGE